MSYWYMINNNYHLRPALQNKPLRLTRSQCPDPWRGITLLSCDRSWWVSNVIPPLSVGCDCGATSLNTNLTMSVIYAADQSSQLPSFLVSADNVGKYFRRKRFSQQSSSHWRPHRAVRAADWLVEICQQLSLSVSVWVYLIARQLEAGLNDF